MGDSSGGKAEEQQAQPYRCGSAPSQLLARGARLWWWPQTGTEVVLSGAREAKGHTLSGLSWLRESYGTLILLKCLY